MKIVNAKVLNNGMDKTAAQELFDKIAAFAGYGFNRSHAIEYSIISYWTMWVRVRYPAEYFAACLSVVGDDKVPGLVADARSCGIEVLPPDVNRSTDRFEIPDNKHLLAPFSKVKGCSENTARRIVELRSSEPFKDDADFEKRLAVTGSKVNIRVRDALRAVGATASIDPTQKAARHPDRRREQTELMPGLVLDAVKADRTTDVTDKFVRAKVIHIVQEYRACGDCDLAGQPHPQVRLKSNVKFMVVSDCPSWQEEKQDKLMEGDVGKAIRAAITAAGLSPGDGYYTTLVKAKKSEKFLTNDQINGCAKFLERELEVIKPAVIVALGSATIRKFLPGMKGGSAEMCGKVVFDPKLDASIVCGFNAQAIHFDPDKQEVLEEVFKKVAEIVT
jgi:DNA polymerase-3 subunit alpha